MEWNEYKGTWFPLGREKFPSLEAWKELSSVRGARRVGAISEVDEALEAARQACNRNDMLEMYLAAFELFLACDKMLREIGTFDLQAKQRREAVEELRKRARAARDYFSSATPVIQAILASPVDIFQLKTSKPSVQVLVDAVFRNFVDYASRKWRYIGTSNWGGPDILAGKTTSVPCGGIANALRIILDTVLPAGVPPARFVTISGRVLTRKKYHCFDPLVRGNVRLKTDELDGSCLFNKHFFLGWGGLYYDPCMAAIYTCENDVIEEVPESLPGVDGLNVVAKRNAQKADSLFIFDERTTVQGFNSSWARVPIAEVKDVDSLVQAVPTSLKSAVLAAPAAAKAIVEYCTK